MQEMNVALKVLRDNSTAEKLNNSKILKRVARIEDKLKIVNVEEPIPLTEKQLEEIKEGD